ncbi:hypothetical protein J437_LFUL005614 [Ladona fulva]|uniref:Uncharacterized protein n=1 Tax=Ladona fulva TaxID=123851 RepID=A0A8K0K1B7_LADFU|nr:hypothetical protein J437_LFUL005614 [Ladona fulva]
MSDRKAPKRIIFDLVEGIPKGEQGTHTKADENLTTMKVHTVYPEIPEKIDIYYFDHGNAAYYQTTDNPPPILAEMLVEKSDVFATRFWAEVFGSLHLFVAFITTFILQLIRFLLHSLLRPLTVGIIQLISDYLLKPLLTIVFNGVLQPCLILLYNIATSFRDVCEPLAQALGFWMTNFAILFQSIRLIDIHKRKCNHCQQKCEALEV